MEFAGGVTGFVVVWHMGLGWLSFCHSDMQFGGHFAFGRSRSFAIEDLASAGECVSLEAV